MFPAAARKMIVAKNVAIPNERKSEKENESNEYFMRQIMGVGDWGMDCVKAKVVFEFASKLANKANYRLH